MMSIHLILLVLLIVFDINILAQELCHTNSGFSGECVLVRDCPSITQNLDKISIDKIIDLVCGKTLTNDDVKVCCPPVDAITSNSCQQAKDFTCGISKSTLKSPWFVSLYSDFNNVKENVCNGVLISANRVLTTYECAQNQDVKFAFLGYPSEFNTQIKLIPVIGSDHNTVAIIKLAYKVTFDDTIKPICIPTSRAQIQNHNFFVTKTERSRNDRSISVNTVPANILHSKECTRLNLLGTNFQINDGSICSTHNMTCDYDQLSSFLISVDPETKKHYIVGIGQLSQRTCFDGPDSPDVRSNVYFYYKWIEDVILNN